MKKTITLLLTLCLLLGLLPTEAVAFAGDIYRAGDVTQVKMADGSLSLQNGYVHVTLHKLLETYSYLTVVPAAKPDEDSMWNSQTPYCNYTTYKQGVPTTEGVVISLKKMEFVTVGREQVILRLDCPTAEARRQSRRSMTCSRPTVMSPHR